MSGVFHIMMREVGDFFSSLTAYIVVILFLLIAGGMFWLSYFDGFQEVAMRNFFADAPLFLAFFAPAITMGTIAKERRTGTLETLQTLPVTEGQVVLGKFLAALSLLCVTFLFTVAYPLSLSTLGDLDWGPVLGGYLGLFLLGSAYLSVGVMVSTWAKDQVVAVLLGFFLCFVLFILDQLAGSTSGMTATMLEQLSANYHFRSISKGVIRLSDVAYYLSVVTASLAVARVSLQARRW